MALAISTDLVVVTAADTNTGWTKFGTTTPATEPDYFAQGTGCVSLIFGNPKGGTYDIGASTIDFNSGTHQDKLVYVWMRIATPSLIDAISAGGMYVILGSGTTAPGTAAGVWSAWTVDGSNTIVGTDGWICYVIDPQSTPSTTYGGGVDLNAVRHFGGAHEGSSGSAKGQVFGIDAIYYGRGELYITGAVATAGEGFKEAAALDFGVIGTRYGIITEKRGIYYVRGKLILRTKVNTNASANWTVAVSGNVVTVTVPAGHGFASNQKINTNASWTINTFMNSLTDKTITVTGTTTFTFALTQGNQGATGETGTSASVVGNVGFSSYGESVVFETPHYYNGTAATIVKSIPDASVGSVAGADGKTSYNGLAILGDSVGRVTVDFGVLVGSAQGRSGPIFSSYKNPLLSTPARTLCTVTVDANVNNLSIYGTVFNNLEGAIDLQGTNIDDDDCFGNTFNGCGRIDSNMEIRNCSIVNSVSGATDGAYLWNSTTNLQTCNFVNCSRGIVFESSTGTPFSFSNISFSGNTYDVRNETGAAIVINYTGGTTPTYENSGGGSSTTVSASVTVTVTVVDKNDSPIGSAQVGVYVGTTEVINADTTGSGIATANYSGALPANAIYKVRKTSTGGTRYTPVSGPAVIDATNGMSVKVVLYVDPAAA